MTGDQFIPSTVNKKLSLVSDDGESQRPTEKCARSPGLRKEFQERIPELLDLECVMRKYPELLEVRIEQKLVWRERELPLYSITLGSRAANAPTVLMTAGMHGIERIGTQVLIAWLKVLLERLGWDKNLQRELSQVQLVVMPILNPVGMYLNRRCNGNGVDLNRNAPIEAQDGIQLLGGGHRLSSFLPWYRGHKDQAMEAENLALEAVIKRQIINRPMALSLDLHSGFGTQDRLWFPYAYRRKPIDNIAHFVALKNLWERTYPHHTYVFEPQSIHYLSHGDVWDYFYRQHRHIQQTTAKKNRPDYFLPLTLEMGSWAWVKKRPRQLFNFAGLFNPQMKHRHSRVLRSHIILLDFIIAAALNSDSWLPDDQHSALFEQTADSLWFS